MWLSETEKVLNILSEEEGIKDYVFVDGSIPPLGATSYRYRIL